MSNINDLGVTLLQCMADYFHQTIMQFIVEYLLNDGRQDNTELWFEEPEGEWSRV